MNQDKNLTPPLEELGKIIARYHCARHPLPASQLPNSHQPASQAKPVDQAAEDFARYLRAQRNKAQLTQQELASKADLSATTIFALEQGLILSTMIRTQTLQKLADALALDVAHLALMLDRPIPARGVMRIFSEVQLTWAAVVAYFGSPLKAMAVLALMICTLLSTWFYLGESSQYVRYIMPGISQGGDSNNSGALPAITTISYLEKIEVTPCLPLINMDCSWSMPFLPSLNIGFSEVMIVILMLLVMWFAMWRGDVPFRVVPETLSGTRRIIIYATVITLAILSNSPLSSTTWASPIQFAKRMLDNPAAILLTHFWDPYTIYNNRLIPPSASSIEADIADGGRSREASGQGIYQNNVEDNDHMHTHAVRIDGRDAARGMTLYPQAHVCNNFDTNAYWATLGKRPPVDAGRALANVWSDWYGGWGPFAVDGGYYTAKNTTFSLERNVGPGENSGSGYSVKIASNQPYAGGFGSPMIKVTPGAQVTVKVNYLLWDHDFKGLDYDWASMGVKADTEAAPVRYVNSYTRGHWSQLENTVTAGPNGYVMVLLQGHSPAALNSNIYFDDVRIQVNGEYMANCIWASETE